MEVASSQRKTAPGTAMLVVRSVLLPAQIVVAKPGAAMVVADVGEGLVPITALPVFAKQDGFAGFRTQTGYEPAARPV